MKIRVLTVFSLCLAQFCLEFTKRIVALNQVPMSYVKVIADPSVKSFLFLLPLGIYALFYTHLLDKGCKMILNLISKSGKAKAKSFKMLFAVPFIKMVI